MSDFTEEQVLALARRAYHEGDAHIPLLPARSALLVIDMQEAFVRPGWTPFWVPDATRQVPRVRALVEACRAAGVPVIYTLFDATHQRLDRPRSGQLMPNRYPDITPDPAWFRDGEVWHELAPRPDEVVIRKPSYGAYYDTPLETILRNLGRDTILISGTLTNFCCGMTARQGYERGFQVIFGSDVTATDLQEHHEGELRVLRKGFARVMSLAEMVAELAGAGHG
jgi:nicotinamidase-related amidase